jgi:hypothetical protein
MFTPNERARVRQHVLELAHEDERIVAGAEVGSLALGGGDRWSDLDLTFAITDRGAFEGAIVRPLDREELGRTLTAGIKALLRECELGDDDERIRDRLGKMVASSG